MDDQDIRTLKIFERLEEDQCPSQRAIAKKLNISLGLVNSFIKRLVNKGYFKVTNLPANRVKYILTPAGAAEKTKLTYEYIKFSFNFYQATRQRLEKLFHDFEEQGIQRLVFHGAGELAEIAYLSLQETSISLVAISDLRKAGESLVGTPIVPPADLLKLRFDRVMVTAISPADDNVGVLTQLGIDPARIVQL